jgi:hypothetical protein
MTPETECATLARKLCRRKHAHKAFLGVVTDTHGNTCARFQSTIRGNEWNATLADLRLLARRS